MCVSEFGCKCVHQTVLREARPIVSSNVIFSKIGRKIRPNFHPGEIWTNISVHLLRSFLKMVISRLEEIDGNVVQFLILRRKLDGKLDGNVGPHRRCPTFPSNFSSNFLSNIKNWTTFLSNFSGLKIIILRTNLKNWTDMFVQFSLGFGRIFRPIFENRKLDEKIGRASRSTV